MSEQPPEGIPSETVELRKPDEESEVDQTQTTTAVITDGAPVDELEGEDLGEACLVLLIGPEIGKRYSLPQGKLLVGRDSSCAIPLRESSVSRRHSEIAVHPDRTVVRDLGSTNGTYVNDRLVTSATLRDGDIVKFGRIIFKYLSGANIENAYHQEIYRLTTTDPMTQVYNRRYFMESLSREISRARRYQHSMALLMIDLDHFKHINDTYGHLAGDHVLKMVGRSLQRSLRREDILARYGGEEFAVILPETSSERAVQVGERLRRSVAKRAYSFDGFPIPVTVSLGVSELRSDDDEFGRSLIERSDQSLLKAKEQGRNRVVGA